MIIEHNRAVKQALPITDTEERPGTICILLRDGRLFGPFTSAKTARYWAVSQELAGFSTYDLLPPR